MRVSEPLRNHQHAKPQPRPPASAIRTPANRATTARPSPARPTAAHDSPFSNDCGSLPGGHRRLWVGNGWRSRGPYLHAMLPGTEARQGAQPLQPISTLPELLATYGCRPWVPARRRACSRSNSRWRCSTCWSSSAWFCRGRTKSLAAAAGPEASDAATPPRSRIATGGLVAAASGSRVGSFSRREGA